MPKIKGLEFDFGGAVLTIPPLSLGDLELLQDRISALQVGSVDPASVGTIIDSTLAALQRNYPEITRADVAALIDLENMVDVLECVMDVSGTRRKATEAAKKAASAAESSSC